MPFYPAKIELLDKHGTGHDNQIKLVEWAKQAKILAKIAVGNSHHVEYYLLPNDWMTAEMFSMYSDPQNCPNVC